MKEKTYVEDVDRSMYDFRNEDKDAYKVKEGLNPAIVEQISNEKHDPEWMKEFRMKSLEFSIIVRCQMNGVHPSRDLIWITL